MTFLLLLPNIHAHVDGGFRNYHLGNDLQSEYPWFRATAVDVVVDSLRTRMATGAY